MDLIELCHKFLRGKDCVNRLFRELVRVALATRIQRSELRLKRLQGCKVITVEGDYQNSRREYERLYEAFRHKCQLQGLEAPEFNLDDLCNAMEKFTKT